MKIESGCLALIVNSTVQENIGKCVTALRFIGEVKGFIGVDRWETDGAIMGNHGSIVNHQREAYLMRIDGIKNESTEIETNIINKIGASQ